MTPEERRMIEDLFQRLRGAETGQKDRDADELIRHLAAQTPGAAYNLVSLALLQQQAVEGAQTRIAELERLAAPGGQPAAAASAGSFLGSSPWGNSGGARSRIPSGGQVGRSGMPPQGHPQQQAFGGGQGGGSFLRSAMTTAAGVAGGALLFSGLQNLLSHHPSGAFSGPAAEAATPPGDKAAALDEGILGQPGGVQDAGYDQAYDEGGDFGGGDDFA